MYHTWVGVEGTVLSSETDVTRITVTKDAPDNHYSNRVGQEKGLITGNLELIPPSAFKVGDKVKVISLNGNSTRTPVGLEGVIERQTLTGYWRVNFGAVDPSTHLFYAQELELIEEKEEPEVTEEPEDFGFADIQEGDTIRRTKVYESGATEVREGTVGTKGSYYWADAPGNFILAYAPDHEHSEGVTYELLERPEPEEPELWENREPGDKIVTYFKHDGALDRIFIKQENGLWSTLVNTSSGKIGRGFHRADKDIAEFLSKRQTVTASLVRA